MSTSPAPQIPDVSAGFWDLCDRRVLGAPRCRRCRSWFFPPTLLCSSCHSRDWDFEPTAGVGTVYSFTVVHKAPGVRRPLPHAIAIIELREGCSLVAGVTQWQGLSIGDDVEVDWDASTDAR